MYVVIYTYTYKHEEQHDEDSRQHQQQQTQLGVFGSHSGSRDFFARFQVHADLGVFIPVFAVFLTTIVHPMR